MLIKVDDNNVFNRTINSVRPCPTNLKPNSADGGNKTTRRRRCFVLRWHFLAINFLRLRKIPFYNFKMRSISLTDFFVLAPFHHILTYSLDPCDPSCLLVDWSVRHNCQKGREVTRLIGAFFFTLQARRPPWSVRVTPAAGLASASFFIPCFLFRPSSS